MSSKDIRRINESFENGIVPPEFNFFGNNNDDVDWDKVRYNSFYRTTDYFLNKFPPGFENLPAAENILENMIINVKSPLEEMREREKESINKIWEESIKNLSIESIENNEQETITSQSTKK
jgi:hypothetical protein